jgi:Protein of unknown function (DUF3306)
MSEEDFLARWSRRKREVAKAEAEVEVEPRLKTQPPAKEPIADAVAKPEFDIASLPPIESINALTDVTAFLRAGVPAELTRAALRRVWTADPAVRDFVGLAENAWDFTDPSAIPGFGPLESSEDVRRMVASIMEKVEEVAEAGRTPSEQSASNSKRLSESGAADESLRHVPACGVAEETGHQPADDQVILQGNKVDTAVQHDVAESQEALPKSSRRAHGGALPG